ncbi:hypothetical protein IQ454_004582 [Salmonella enterica]|nr:hypothetical protein [Salmonella enterica]EGL4359767.1 hypothetical protein [Salmonella enterica]EGL4382761.1 hypothetical protein [Salmonella enterica]EGL4488007.1 hypothetical protein [Salmonella enterica]EGL4515167.1 hypothetical protein [Salmonella enterica]
MKIEKIIDWCGGYAKFGAMMFIIALGVICIILSLYDAEYSTVVACLILIPIITIIARKIIP